MIKRKMKRKKVVLVHSSDEKKSKLEIPLGNSRYFLYFFYKKIKSIPEVKRNYYKTSCVIALCKNSLKELVGLHFMKDKLAGYSIFILSLAILGAWGTFTIWGIIDWTNSVDPIIPPQVTVILLTAPIFLAMIVVLSIAAWIGWTMARTPPPAPIDLEDFESVEETKEKKK